VHPAERVLPAVITELAVEGLVEQCSGGREGRSVELPGVGR
jgi:hypothetical protein